MNWKLAATGIALLSLPCMAHSQSTAPAEGNFDTWVKVLTAANNSPAAAEPGDYQTHWTAPDGRKIQITIKRPRPLATAPVVTLAPVAEGADARPAFDKAIAEARSTKAKRLIIPKGTYVFKSMGQGNITQWLISGLTDITIDGSGSTLIFNLNQPGISIRTSRRLALANLNIEFGLKMAALGTVVAQGGENVLKIDPDYPVTAADTMGHMGEYDRVAKRGVPGGMRVYSPPGSKEVPKYIGNQTYTSPAFQQKGMEGKSFLVFQQWYGAAALEVKDSPGPLQDEDITLSGIAIHSGPGMGIIAYGLKRGLEITNCQIAPKPGALISTEYDAIHTLVAGGDVSIHDNIIRGQGDDAINLNNPVHPVAKIDPDGKSVVLSTYSRFIQPHDHLTAFDETNKYLGSAEVMDKPTSLGGPNNQWYGLTLNKPIPGLTLRSFIRDDNLVNGRVAIMHNMIADCGCHGLLVQIPNVLVSDNTFSNTSANAIRLLANVASFKEGTGAMNVLVRDNTITHTGIDTGIHALHWAAIAVYGNGANGVTSAPANRYIDIINNTITSPAQGCITISSAELVNVIGNTCNDTNLLPSFHRQPSIYVSYSEGVVLKDNHRSGTWTGEIVIDPDTTKGITTQKSY